MGIAAGPVMTQSAFAGMPRPFATYLARVESAFRGRSQLLVLKARLLAICSLVIVLIVPLNMMKLAWLQPPFVGHRLVFGVCMLGAAWLSLHWLRAGHVNRAANGLVLTATIAIHVLLLLVPAYDQPLSAAILMFSMDLVFLLLALVFATRVVAAGVLGVVVASHLTFHLRELHGGASTDAVHFAADTLVRFGIVAFILVFLLGIALVRMIEEAHRRGEEALDETRAMNANLNQLVAARTGELEAAINRANDASRAKGDFLANMSHEIRTPLNGIIASADLLWRRADLTPAAAEHVRLIADSGEHLLKQLSDILDFSKIEAGQLELETHCFDLAALTSDCTALMKSRAEEGGMNLCLNVDESLPQFLLGDSYRLRQVLLNLMANAIKFTPTGGEVRLAVSHAGTRSEAILVRFEISDTGIGMDEPTMKRIFERFTQADSSTTRRYGGTGLGLAISSRIVAMMRGTIQAESAPGEGSRFYFTVPFDRAETLTQVLPLAPRVKPPRLGLRVLVAEDNAMNRKILAAQLDALGCTCSMVNDGEEVLMALRKDALPDLVLMDCHMPNLDGWEATRRLRGWAADHTAAKHEREAGLIPVIALTAAALPEERARCAESGMNAFLSKPVKLSELQAALQPYTQRAVAGN